MYDFTYRSASAPTLGVFAPLKIEGAPDHGTIADAQVWAAHYDVRIDLLDGAGRVRRVVDSDGQVRDLKTVLLDSAGAFERLRDVGLRRIDFWQEPPVSLSYDMAAAFRGQTCPDQFEVKRTAPVRARHLSGVSVNLLIAVGHRAQRLGFWGPNEVDLFDTNGGA